MRHHVAGHAHLSLRCRLDGAPPRCWPAHAAAAEEEEAEPLDALRFPYFAPLLHALVRPLASGLPPQYEP